MHKQFVQEKLSVEDLKKIHATAQYLAECVDLGSEEEIRCFIPEEVRALSLWGKSIIFPLLKVVQLEKPLNEYSKRRVHDALFESFFPELSQPEVINWRCAPGSGRN